MTSVYKYVKKKKLVKLVDISYYEDYKLNKGWEMRWNELSKDQSSKN